MATSMRAATRPATARESKLAVHNYAISPAQCRAARALLGWTQTTLAELSGLARKTVADFEAGGRSVRFRSRRDIALAFDSAGIEFIWNTDRLVEADRPQRGGEGVRRAQLER